MGTWLVPRQDLTIEQLRAIEMPAHENQVFLGGPGSGKTQVLLHRADFLRRTGNTPSERIHIFVFTNVLKDYIRSAVELLGLPTNCVSTLDSWCSDYFQQNIGNKLPWDAANKTRDYAAIRRAVLTKLKASASSSPIFDFILVDEGQDLDSDAFELIKAMGRWVTVCMDGNQQIYDAGSSQREVLAKLGLRKHNLALLQTFRCCPYIVDAASQFIDDPEERQAYIRQTCTSQTDIETPLFYRASDFEDERRKLIEVTKVRLEKGEKVAILLPQKRQVYGFAKGLQEAGLPVETQEALSFVSDLPKLITMHSAKGLTFDTVLLPRLNARSFINVSPARMERLLFVAITRATRWLYISTDHEGTFTPLLRLYPLIGKKRLTMQIGGTDADLAPTDRKGHEPVEAESDRDDLLDML